MKNRRLAEQYYKPEPLRPIFEQNELDFGIWMELVPHKLKMVIVEPGVGPNPRVGEFVRAKQFLYLDNMTNVKQQRATYLFGRNKLIPGLQFCLALCREGFKGRFYIDASLAYGPQPQPGIPANSNLIMDMEVNSITAEPLSTGQREDKQLIQQILCKAGQGDEFARRGQYEWAQRSYEHAFARIQSTRCKEIKNYLYSHSKINYMINNGERTQADINRELAEVVRMYDAFDVVKIKTVEMALLNKDYYRVIFLTKQCILESRLEQNHRVLAARARAFSQVGQFQAALEIMQHLHDQSPDIPAFKDELQRIQDKFKQFKRSHRNEPTNPVLALTKPNKPPKKHKKARIEHQEDDYQADQQIEQLGPFSMGVGMPIYHDFSYFE